MKEIFCDGENVIFYTSDKLDEINDRVNAYLADEPKRAALAQAGHDVVMKYHTWDNRAEALIEGLKAIEKENES